MKEVNKVSPVHLMFLKCWWSPPQQHPPLPPLLLLGQVPPFRRIPSCIGLLCSVPRDLVRCRGGWLQGRVTSTCCDSHRATNHLEPLGKRNQERGTTSHHFGAFLITDARGVREVLLLSVGCQRLVIRSGMRATWWNNPDSAGWNNNFVSWLWPIKDINEATSHLQSLFSTKILKVIVFLNLWSTSWLRENPQQGGYYYGQRRSVSLFNSILSFLKLILFPNLWSWFRENLQQGGYYGQRRSEWKEAGFINWLPARSEDMVSGATNCPPRSQDT